MDAPASFTEETHHRRSRSAVSAQVYQISTRTTKEISDAFARVEKNEVWLYNAHVDEYAFGNRENHQPKAPRKLLLHKSEIRKLFGLASIKGNAIFPLSFYWKNGKVKVALGVGKGKLQFDKRDDIKKRESDREMKRATMHRFKGK